MKIEFIKNDRGKEMSLFKKTSHITIIVFLALLFIGPFITYTDAKDRCIECHKDTKFRVQNKILFDYYNNWKDSTHDIASVSCNDCHGGDPTKRDKKDAHKDGFSSLTSIDNASFKKIPKRCGKCHEEVLKNFKESKHYKALLEKGTGPHCSTCHGSVNINVYYTSVIARSCKDCHNAYTKNHPEIVGEADKILHRINVSHAYKRWLLIDYQDVYPAEVEEIIMQYADVAESWHKFDFRELDQKSEELLNKIKSLVSKGLEEKRTKKKVVK